MYRPSHTPQTPPDIDVLREQWREVFIITAEVNVFSLIVFMVTGSAKLQLWVAVHADNNGTKCDPLTSDIKALPVSSNLLIIHIIVSY